MQGREIRVPYSLLNPTPCPKFIKNMRSPPDALAITLVVEVSLGFLHCIWWTSPVVAAKERVNGVVGGQWPWLSLLRDGGREECFRNAK